MNGTATGVQLIDFEQASPAAVAAVVGDHAESRLLVEPPFAGGPRHGYLLELLRADAGRDDAIARAAVSGAAVTGLSVLRLPRWDEENFGFCVGRVEHLIAADAASAHALAAGIVRDLAARDAGMCSARLSVEARPALHALEAQGFRFQEHTLSPWRELAGWQSHGFAVTRETRPDDLPELGAIARRAFRADRFHGDPRFERAAADGLYERWLQTWHEAQAPEKWGRVLLVDGRPAGFILFDIIELPAHRVGRVVLDCVAPELAGRGHGYQMHCDALDFLSGRAAYVSTVIATANSAALQLNIRLGFRFSGGGEVTLHRWAQNG